MPAPFDGTVVTRTAEPGEVVQAGTPIVTLLDLQQGLPARIRSGRADRQGEGVGQPARVLSRFGSEQAAWTPYVSRIDPQATFTPENTYFRDDRVKQVVGVKLQIEGRSRFRQAGHAGRWRDPRRRRHWPEQRAMKTVRVDRRLRPRTTRAGSRNPRDGLSKRYGAVEAVRGIDLEVQRGEIFGLIGPDGAGKTIDVPDSRGRHGSDRRAAAEIFGRPAREARSQTGYLTQAFSLYPGPHGRREHPLHRRSAARCRATRFDERGRRYLQMFDMDRFTDRLAGRLSGGMKQKLALACALVAAAARAAARRADDRRRSGLAPRVLGHAGASRRRRTDDPGRDALSGRSRALPPRGADASGRDPADWAHPPNCASSFDAKRLEVRTDESGPRRSRCCSSDPQTAEHRRRAAVRRPARRDGAAIRSAAEPRDRRTS